MKTRINTKNVIQSKHFKSFFHTMVTISSVVCIFLLTLSFVRNSSIMISEIEKDNINIANSLQKAINSTQSCATFVGSLPSVSLILNHDSPEVSQLSRMINDITSFSSVYDYENITLFFDKSQRIYDSSNGTYHYNDYWDASFLETVTNSADYERWLCHKPSINGYNERETEFLTYIHRLPIYETAPKGYVSFSLPLKYIERMVENTRSTRYPLTISFKELVLFSDQKNDSSSNESSYIYEISYSEDNDILISRHLSVWSFINIFMKSFIQFLVVFLIALCVSFVISFFVAIVTLRPVDNLLQNAGLPSFIESEEMISDEYYVLNHMIEEMSLQVKNKDQISIENKQLLQEQLLYNLLYDYENPLSLPRKYEEHGISFYHNFFTLILIDFTNIKNDPDSSLDREQTMLLTKKNAEDAFSHIGKCYGLYLGNRYIALILNTEYSDHLRNEIYKICTAISISILETLSIRPLFGIALCSSKSPNLYHALLQAQRVFLFAEKDSDNYIYFTNQTDYTSSIDSTFLLNLTQGIINHDSLKIKEMRAYFAEHYTNTTSELAEFKRYCQITVCAIYLHLLQLNIKMPETIFTTAICKLEKTQSFSECENILFNCFLHSTSDSSKMSEDATIYIQQTIHYLTSHYSEPITMPQIASYVGISSIYLNRIFKSATGKTLSDYLNEYRISKSIELLVNKQLTINSISEQVGYNDVRSYIRFFKKYHGLTPSEYRQTQQTNIKNPV